MVISILLPLRGAQQHSGLDSAQSFLRMPKSKRINILGLFVLRSFFFTVLLEVEK